MTSGFGPRPSVPSCGQRRRIWLPAGGCNELIGRLDAATRIRISSVDVALLPRPARQQHVRKSKFYNPATGRLRPHAGARFSAPCRLRASDSQCRGPQAEKISPLAAGEE